jgi:hypothetical protein
MSPAPSASVCRSAWRTIPKELAALVPRGKGNKEIAEAAPFQKAAREVGSAIIRIESDLGCKRLSARTL